MEQKEGALLEVWDQRIQGRRNAQLLNTRAGAQVICKRPSARAAREIDSDRIGILPRLGKKLLTAPARRAVNAVLVDALIINCSNNIAQVGNDPGTMHHACIGLGSDEEDRAVGNRGQARNDILQRRALLLCNTENPLAKLLIS